MNTIGVQTQQFLMFIDFQHKLTKINDHIKALKQRQDFYKFKNEYLQYKNSTLMDSLFQSERCVQQVLSRKKLDIIKDLQDIQKQIQNQFQELVNIKVNTRSFQGINRNSLKETSKNNSSLQKRLNSIKNSNENVCGHCSAASKEQKNKAQQKISQQIGKLKIQIKQLKIQNHRVFQMNDQLKTRNRKIKKLLQYQQLRFMKQQDRMQARVNIEKFKSSIMLMKYKNKDKSQHTQDMSFDGQESGLFDSQTKRKYC